MNALLAPHLAQPPSSPAATMPPRAAQTLSAPRPARLIAHAPLFERAMPSLAPSAPSEPSEVGAAWPQAILDELDYGILLVAPDLQLMLLNRAARAELDDLHPLQLRVRQLHTREATDNAALQEALHGATQRGLRRLLTLGHDAHRVSLAVVPLGGDSLQRLQPAMVILGKRQVCERLSVQWFAHGHALTPAETRVLEHLCAGQLPRDIARSQGVGLATVRTQIGSIRVKTGAASIRELVQQVAVLPPMVNRLQASNGG